MKINSVVGTSSDNKSQLSNTLNGSILSSLTTSASQNAETINNESIKSVITRFVARDEFNIERIKLSTTSSLFCFST